MCHALRCCTASPWHVQHAALSQPHTYVHGQLEIYGTPSSSLSVFCTAWCIPKLRDMVATSSESPQRVSTHHELFNITLQSCYNQVLTYFNLIYIELMLHVCV